jgi:hypothetical protein
MPKLTADAMQTDTVYTGASHFQFSAVRPDCLGASDYTLVTVVVDISGSVMSFKDELLAAVKAIVRSCQYSPRADNLLVRLLIFNQHSQEQHGFKPLRDIDPDGYAPFAAYGSTALYDATADAVLAICRYGELLVTQGFAVNAVVYVITDGCDNASNVGPHQIAEALRDARQAEKLESLVAVLIGINERDRSVGQALQAFQAQAELTRYLAAGEATATTLARLAAFVSRSIHAQSVALGTGSAAPVLTF